MTLSFSLFTEHLNQFHPSPTLATAPSSLLLRLPCLCLQTTRAVFFVCLPVQVEPMISVAKSVTSESALN